MRFLSLPGPGEQVDRRRPRRPLAPSELTAGNPREIEATGSHAAGFSN